MYKVLQIILTILLSILSVAAFFGVAEWIGTINIMLSIFFGYVVGSVLAFLVINWWFFRRTKHE